MAREIPEPVGAGRAEELIDQAISDHVRGAESRGHHGANAAGIIATRAPFMEERYQGGLIVVESRRAADDHGAVARYAGRPAPDARGAGAADQDVVARAALNRAAAAATDNHAVV